jgi:branched-chain amino acid transport system substrate-binding protein
MKTRIWLTALAAAVVAGSASAQELRIGYMNTLNHPLGKTQVQGFKLGLAHVGWTKDGDKISGVPTKVVYCDDQFKPDVGISCAKKLIEQDKVQILAGITWSNILAAVQRVTRRNKVLLISTNAGWSGMAGKQCSKYFVSSSWNNDQMPEAMGQLMNEDHLKNVFVMAPNYQAGKDMIAGLKRTYKGKISGQILYKLGQSDFQAELTRIRAAKPAAVYIFGPGPMGIAFFKQWGASGLGKNIKLYSVYTVDYLSLKPIGKAAIGTYHANFWDPDSKIPANVKYIADFKAKYGRHPDQYSVQGYDAALLIAAAVKATGGKVNDTVALSKAMRESHIDSPRGKFTYNVNGIPIQNFYRREVVRGADGKPAIKTTGVVFANRKDSYWKQCPASQRLK